MANSEYASGSPIAAEDIPEDLARRVGPDAPPRARMAVAKALLPMPMEQLCVAAAILARDPDGDLAAAATSTLDGLDAGVVETASKDASPAAALDFFAHHFKDRENLLILLVNNPATAHDTVRWMARTLRGYILEHIGRAQTRYIAQPKIIEAMIANPAVSSSTLTAVIETAVRLEVDGSKINGFRQLADAMFADIREAQEAAVEDEPDFLDEQESTAPEGVPDDVMELVLRDGQQRAEVEASEGADEVDGDDEPSTPEGEDGEAGEEDDGKAGIRALISKMSTVQKVRLALTGDAKARSILVRDPKKLVAMAVLKSPRLTDKEIANFAQNKTISEDVIRMIANSREWTRNYSVRLALVRNPKTPAAPAVGFLRALRGRDVKQLAKAKDVPQYLARAAKQLLSKRGG